MLRPQCVLLLVLLPLCYGILMDERDIDTDCVEGHLNNNVAVQDAINKCFKDAPEEDSQSDPASQMKNLKVRYKKLVHEYKKAMRKLHERGDEFETDNIEPEDSAEENDKDDVNEENNDEDPQDHDKINQKDGNDSPREEEEVSSKRSSDENSVKDAPNDEVTVNGDEATKENAKDAQSADDTSNGKDSLGFPENDAKSSKNEGIDRKEDPLPIPDNVVADTAAEEEVNGDISEELDDPFEDEPMNGAANEADSEEPSSRIPVSELDQKG